MFLFCLLEEHPGKEPSEELQVQRRKEQGQEGSNRKVVATAAALKTVQRLSGRKVFLPINDPNRKREPSGLWIEQAVEDKRTTD